MHMLVGFGLTGLSVAQMHMLVGVLRRQVRGAEPMSKHKHQEVSESMARVDIALGRLEAHLHDPHVSVDKTDRVLAMVEGELNIVISNIDTVEKFRRFDPLARLWKGM